MIVWMEVTKDRFRLPLAVADSAHELARLRRVDVSVVSRGARTPGGKYVRVRLDEPGTDCHGLCPRNDAETEDPHHRGNPRKIDDARALELYEAGYYDHEIAEAFGASTTAVWQWRRKRGLPTQWEKDETGLEEAGLAGDTAWKKKQKGDSPSASIAPAGKDDNESTSRN